MIQFIRDGGVLTDFDMAYPSLIKDILPTPVLGFFAAVMFGAILSSFNSVLNSSMTLFTLDILPVISKRKRTDAQLITIAKRFGIVLCLASIIIAPFLLYLPAGISTFLNQMWGYYGVPVLAIVVMGILAPRMPSFAPKVAIIVHIVCYGLMMNLGRFHFLRFEVGAFVIDLILMAILTKAAPRKEAYVLPDLEVVDMTPWKIPQAGYRSYVHPAGRHLCAVLSSGSGRLIKQTEIKDRSLLRSVFFAFRYSAPAFWGTRTAQAVRPNGRGVFSLNLSEKDLPRSAAGARGVALLLGL